MKLNHYLAKAGICSRRNAALCIANGDVRINNAVQTNPAYVVQTKDTVSYLKKPVTIPDIVYVLINKPVGYVTTTSDEQGRPTVLDLLPFKMRQALRLFPVGRLDIQTTGLILLTNDGDMAQELAHPTFNMSKEYTVIVDKPIDPVDMIKLKKGVFLEDGRANIDHFRLSKQAKQKATVAIHSGKKHIVRRLFFARGYDVRSLQRTAFGPFMVKGIKPGSWKMINKADAKLMLDRYKAKQAQSKTEKAATTPSRASVSRKRNFNKPGN